MKFVGSAGLTRLLPVRIYWDRVERVSFNFSSSGVTERKYFTFFQLTALNIIMFKLNKEVRP
jgi:hypothetical protein